MPHDRPRRQRPGGSSSNSRSGPDRAGRRGGSDDRSGSGRARSDDRRGGNGRGGQGSRRDDRDDRGRRSNGRRGGPSRGDGDRYGSRPEPRTEAERRAAEVRKRRGPRRTERTPEREQAKIESREVEEWIDEGSVRDVAAAATKRAASGDRHRPAPEVDPEVVAEIHAAVDPQRAARLSERLAAASAALDRERFDEARRMIAPLMRELPRVAAVHEVAGLAAYRTGRWRHAAQSLELARQLRADPSLLPVLADSYRGLRQWSDVDEVWKQIKAASPPHDVMAEGRIVVASAHADRGDLAEAIAIMQPEQQPPKRVRAHHLRQWYVMADFYDRAGDTVSATRWFRQIAEREPGFADVRERLRSLGR